MRSKRFVGITILIALLMIGSLSALYWLVGQKDDDAVEPKRPIDIWAFRSVLDQQPRMLTIALHKDLWIAYNTVTASLYKAWNGNVEGKLFTDAATTPVSKGINLLTERAGNPWRIKEGSKESIPQIQYKGHRIIKQRITLRYVLTYKDKQIEIQETPDFFVRGNEIGLKRIFVTTDIPVGLSLYLQLTLPSKMSAKDISTNGQLTLPENSSETVVRGALALNTRNATDYSIVFHSSQEAIPSSEKMMTVNEQVEMLIGKNDCGNCHNPETKTIGPSYLSIARRYEYTQGNIETIANKIIRGGSGHWGKIAMTPHPDLSIEDARRMVSYILLAGENKNKATKIDKLLPSTSYSIELKVLTDSERKENKMMPGIATNIYQYQEMLYGFPVIAQDKQPVLSGYLNTININRTDLPEVVGDMVVQASGFLHIKKSGQYRFRSVHDCGLRLTINNKKVIEKNGYLATAETEVFLPAGQLPLSLEYYQRGHRLLSLQWKPDGVDTFQVIHPEYFSFRSNDVKEVAQKNDIKKIPGDNYPLQTVHPAFDLSQARPNDFTPRVGAMDFFADGRMIVCTWDSLGAVYLLKDVMGKDPAKIEVKRIAFGLSEVMGAKIVDNEIYVLQKQELTKLVDLDGDDIIDEYQTICNTWTATDNFHEFAFGLVYKEGYFYGTLATALLQGGSSYPHQTADRGKVIKISKTDGSYRVVASGLRTPNGIGLGVDNEIFVSDNQGDWLPANKIVHVKPGAWFGSRAVDFKGTERKTETPPVVYLAQDEIANSPSQPTLLNIGPYKNQLLYGDITYGGIQRVFVEKINGQYQGAVFQFTQGLEAGVNRLVWGPDGKLYIGGCGQKGNWAQNGKLQYGLQSLSYNNNIPFEMLALRARNDGLEIEFTQALKENAGLDVQEYAVKQWYFEPTSSYGGPKMGEQTLSVKAIKRSADRKKIHLVIPGIKSGHVIYLRLNRNKILSENGQPPWVTESWYTMNNIP